MPPDTPLFATHWCCRNPFSHLVVKCSVMLDAATLRHLAEGAGSQLLGGLVVHGGTRLESLSKERYGSVSGKC
jgi:hypothetical protein